MGGHILVLYVFVVLLPTRGKPFIVALEVETLSFALQLLSLQLTQKLDVMSTKAFNLDRWISKTRKRMQ